MNIYDLFIIFLILFQAQISVRNNKEVTKLILYNI